MNQKISHIMTIANSIIGVGILAMPYCFKQCGIILSICILAASSTVSRLSCHLLLKSAIIARRKTFENLAFHAFGSLGKFIIEVGMIGFLLGTCIAFFVVMGDLGPAIIAKVSGAHATDTLRTSILMALALFCVLPLGLLRNVDSLTSVNTASIGFYLCLVLKLITEAGPHIFSGDWTTKVVLWRPAGILQCLPIFSMALFCQTQIFEVYQAIPNASLDKMNELIRAAVNICTGVYIFVGVFGYISFCNHPFTGNILMSFTPSIVTDAITIGFVLSLAFSFPLVIFPCRASLYSLLYKQVYSFHEGISNYIPEGKFKFLTFLIVFVSLVTGVLIPNIELVLGLVGSTIGIMICVVFPATCFICISVKNTNERLAAQIMLFIGIIIMVLGTYANLYAIEEATMKSLPETTVIKEPNILQIVKEDTELRANAIDIPTLKSLEKDDLNKHIDKAKEASEAVNINEKNPPLKEARQEPPQPVEPEETPKMEPQQIQILEKGPSVDILPDNFKNLEQQNKSGMEDINSKKDIGGNQNMVDRKDQLEEKSEDVLQNKPPEKQIPQHDQAVVLPIQEANEKQKPIKKEIKENKNDEKKDEVDIDAIRKEEKELRDQEEGEKQNNEKLNILKTLEKQQLLLEQQKEILGQIKQQHEETKQNEIDKVNQERLKAVQQIESIAKKAIESLGVDKIKHSLDDGANVKSAKQENEKIDINENKKKSEENNPREEKNSNIDVQQHVKQEQEEQDLKQEQKVDNKPDQDPAKIERETDSKDKPIDNRQNAEYQAKQANLPQNDDANTQNLKYKGREDNLPQSNGANLVSEIKEESAKKDNLIDTHNIIPMPLVNSDIYKNSSSKGIISLFNKTKLETLETDKNDQIKVDTNKKYIVKSTVSEVLKDNSNSKSKDIASKDNTDSLLSGNIVKDRNILEEPQISREKRDAEEKIDVVTVATDENVCEKDTKKVVAEVQDGNNREQEDVHSENIIKKKHNDDNKLLLTEQNSNKNLLLKEKLGRESIKQSLSANIKLPEVDSFNFMANDLQKELNFKVQKRK